MFGSHTAATVNTLRSFSATFRLPFVSTGLPVSVARSRRHRRRRHRAYDDGFLLADVDDDEDMEEVDHEVDMDEVDYEVDMEKVDY